MHRLRSRSIPLTYLNKDLELQDNHQYDALDNSMGCRPGHGQHVWTHWHSSGGYASAPTTADSGQTPILLPAPCKTPDQHRDQHHGACCTGILLLDHRVLKQLAAEFAPDPELYIMVQLLD